MMDVQNVPLACALLLDGEREIHQNPIFFKSLSIASNREQRLSTRENKRIGRDFTIIELLRTTSLAESDILFLFFGVLKNHASHYSEQLLISTIHSLT
jgi:hypothetical protein